MPRKKKDEVDPIELLLQDMLIVQLALAGVPQASIRAVVGCGMDRVTRIGKLLTKSRNKEDE